MSLIRFDVVGGVADGTSVVDGVDGIVGVDGVDGIVGVDGVDGIVLPRVEGGVRCREPGGRVTIGVAETWVDPELSAKAAAVPAAPTDTAATTTPTTMAARRLVRPWLHESFMTVLLGYLLSMEDGRELMTKEL